MGGSFNPVKIVQSALKPITSALGIAAPKVQQAQQAAPIVQQQAAPAQTAPVVTAAQDAESGVSNEKAIRKGKRSLQIARSTGSGTGLNV